MASLVAGYRRYPDTRLVSHKAHLHKHTANFINQLCSAIVMNKVQGRSPVRRFILLDGTRGAVRLQQGVSGSRLSKVLEGC